MLSDIWVKPSFLKTSIECSFLVDMVPTCFCSTSRCCFKTLLLALFESRSIYDSIISGSYRDGFVAPAAVRLDVVEDISGNVCLRRTDSNADSLLPLSSKLMLVVSDLGKEAVTQSFPPPKASSSRSLGVDKARSI